MDLAERIMEQAEALHRKALRERACTVRVGIGKHAQYIVSVVPMGQLVRIEYETLLWQVPRDSADAFKEVWEFIAEAAMRHAQGFYAELAARRTQATLANALQAGAGQGPAPAAGAGQGAAPASSSSDDDSDDGDSDDDDLDDYDTDADSEDDSSEDSASEDDDDDDDGDGMVDIWPALCFKIELIKRGETIRSMLRNGPVTVPDLSAHLDKQTKVLRYMH